MNDTRKENARWIIKTNPDGSTPAYDATLAVLMDIRDELQKLNLTFGYPNTSTPRRKKRK